jgi:hypothetical protein
MKATNLNVNTPFIYNGIIYYTQTVLQYVNTGQFKDTSRCTYTSHIPDDGSVSRNLL